ncbi:MAG: ribonuclease H-like domain-containing protein [Dehalococcoidia bacterium]|nr:ribonuclease H-like domain-containing protein [Dehalococcoidia bacterium]
MIGFPDAYLDIETTGLYAQRDRITVIGIYFHNGYEGRLVQLYNEKLSCSNLLCTMEGTENVFTYNGDRFDIPFINVHFGADLSRMHQHTDLMFDCWKHDLKGGFKAVLRRLDISRETDGLTGLHAVWLWDKYCRTHDNSALDLLLKYNRDDVVNLKQLRESLSLIDSTVTDRGADKYRG